MNELKRCKWCNMHNERYIRYHDEEWGVANFDDSYLFEMLLLESFQAGLSWECVLNKREAFRKAFDGFDAETIAKYGEEKIAELMANPNIIRNRLKINAAVNNAKVFLQIQRQYGSFREYLKGFTKEQQIVELGKTTSPLSDALSRDLAKRGMKFVGSTIVYSYLQAIGVIVSHDPECFMYQK
ncbi:MAG: DNA-3-methyladenine glycosylase I [Oscillospiraceae bacterium]|nr:DNA-3-methyladenine glycosylase I [Oscillospiraceae bacterium]